MTQLHIAVRNGRKAVIPTGLPVIFTAGPIRNGPIWQNEAMRYAIGASAERGKDLFIASPLRDTGDFADDLMPYLAPFDGEENFPRQRAWEQYYLNEASNDNGCILFWLAAPLPRDQWQWPEKSYAQITMLELGYWLCMAEQYPLLNLVIGADPNFPELSTVLFEIKTLLGDNFVVYDNLSQTVDAAITATSTYELEE